MRLSTLSFLAALTVCVITPHANADALGDVCQSLVGSEGGRCLAAAGGRFVDPEAARQCGHLIGAQVTACVGAVAGKIYTDAETRTCGGMVGARVTDCFRRTGRMRVVPRVTPPPPSTNEIRNEIAIALGQLQSGDTPSAAARLQHLLDRMH